MSMIQKDPRYLAVPSERERERMYDDYWDAKHRKAKEEERTRRQVNANNFMELLRVWLSFH